MLRGSVVGIMWLYSRLMRPEVRVSKALAVFWLLYVCLILIFKHFWWFCGAGSNISLRSDLQQCILMTFTQYQEGVVWERFIIIVIIIITSENGQALEL